MKKIVSLILALAMVMAVSSSAFALYNHDHGSSVGAYAYGLTPYGSISYHCYNVSDSTASIDSVLQTVACCGYINNSQWKGVAYSPQGIAMPYRARIGQNSLVYCAQNSGIVGTGYTTSGYVVTSCQEALYRLGYLNSSDVDGAYGTITKAAITLFQNNNGLTADGICGRATWGRLAGTGI